jgi:tRNA (cmo5U34)-methyltransferase
MWFCALVCAASLRSVGQHGKLHKKYHCSSRGPLAKEIMNIPISQKSSLEDIRKRFDNDVERFSNIETGQSATIDAPLVMELISQAAVNSTDKIEKVLDIGCGAGNNTLKLLQYTAPFDCDLVDLSLPMLKKAKERIAAVNQGRTNIHAGDFRTIDLPAQQYDIILAAAVLHHLRDDKDWQVSFQRLYDLTAPGGSLWITDLVSHESDSVHSMMWKRYGEYLYSIGGEEYRNKVFAYIDIEDSPRPVTYQLELLRKVGFKQIDILHKNSCFAAFGAIKNG